MSTSSILLACRDLQRNNERGGTPLLHGITVQVRIGDRCAMVGASGSGKSLLLRALAQLDPRATGAVTFRGQAADEMRIPLFRRHVMYVTQHVTLLPGTVEDNLRIPFQLAARRSESFDRERIVGQLNTLGRDAEFLDKPVSELSGGEARTVTLLRALQLQASVLLLDEPTSSLDDASARAVESLVHAWFTRQPERAYLWVTHSEDQARRVADRVWRMEGGRLDQDTSLRGLPVERS